MATLSSMIKTSEETDMHVVETYDRPVLPHVKAELDGNPWYHDFRTFLNDGSYPELVNPQIEEH